MALIKCPECGKEISDSAKQCPHCGYKSKNLNDLHDIGGAFSPVWSFIYSLFKDGRYWKALIILAISITIGVLSIYYAFESWCMDWILFVGGILLCLTGSLILFVRPIEFGRNKASGKVMKYSTVLLVLGSIAVVTHGVTRIIEPRAFSYDRYTNNAENDEHENNNNVVGTYNFTDEKFEETFRIILNDDGSATIETPYVIKNGGKPTYCSWTDYRSYQGYVRIDFNDYKPVINSWENWAYTNVRYYNLFLDLDGMYVYPTLEHFKAKNPTHRLKLERK